jgi:hypothetical protein
MVKRSWNATARFTRYDTSPQRVIDPLLRL